MFAISVAGPDGAALTVDKGAMRKSDGARVPKARAATANAARRRRHILARSVGREIGSPRCCQN